MLANPSVSGLFTGGLLQLFVKRGGRSGFPICTVPKLYE